tara:strand:+ start:1584 stop:1871 length:288 start_codon:yes stop_codon:yes gene_type:complete
MPSIDSKHFPALAQVVVLGIFSWFASNAQAQMTSMVETTNRLPIVEQKLDNQILRSDEQAKEHVRRIERLERLDEKLGKLAIGLATVTADLRAKH